MIWHDILTALKARNYGAKVGGVIAGSLGRGQGGRFARVGSGDAAASAPKPGKAKRGDVLKAAGVSESDAKALEDFLAGKPVDEDTLAGLFDKGLIDYTSDEKPVANAQGRALANALKRGDVRKATDAVARGGDRAKKRDAKKAPKTAKPKAGGGGKGKAPKPPKAAPQRDPAKDAEKATRIGDQLDVLDAQVRGSQMNEATRVAAQNRLDKAERDLQELAIDAGQKQAAQERIDKIRAALDKRIAAGNAPIPINNEPGEGRARRTTKEAGLTVMKEASGRYRWVIVSSNAFEDKEREIVSEKALAEDADRMDASGEYGPLRWWHVGDVVFEQPGDWLTAKAGPGIDIGVCDFVALHDKMLIESGTFADESVALAVKKAAPHLQVSRGFTHPLGEPVDGVFTAIKGVERSLLPAGTAANAFTSVSVQELKNMATLKEKWDAFKALFDGNEDEATKFAAGVSSKSKELQAAGVAFKEDAPAAVAEATTEAKAEGDMPAGETETESEDMAETVGDMTVDELAAALVASPAFLDALTGVIGKGLEPVAAAVEKAMSAQTEATTKEASEITALKELAAKLDSRIKSLEGDAPTGAKGFVASQARETVTEKQIDLNRAVTDAEKLASFWIGGVAK